MMFEDGILYIDVKFYYGHLWLGWGSDANKTYFGDGGKGSFGINFGVVGEGK